MPARAVTHVEEEGDLVLVAVKAPALATVLDRLGRAVGPGTVILPVPNGLAHVDTLRECGPGRVLGGVMRTVGTLEPVATLVQLRAHHLAWSGAVLRFC